MIHVVVTYFDKTQQVLTYSENHTRRDILAELTASFSADEFQTILAVSVHDSTEVITRMCKRCIRRGIK